MTLGALCGMQGSTTRTEPTVWVGGGVEGRAGGGCACYVQGRRRWWRRVRAVCADGVVLVLDPTVASCTMYSG